MKTIGNFIKYFLYITVGIFVVCGISFTLSGMETVSVDTFGMILLSAFVTALLTVFLLPAEEDGKGKTLVKYAMHYIILCIIMSFLGIKFGWIPFEVIGICLMAVDVGLVYFIVFISSYIIDNRQAGEINKRLQEKYGNEEV